MKLTMQTYSKKQERKPWPDPKHTLPDLDTLEKLSQPDTQAAAETEAYRVTLRPLPDESDPKGVRRLRLALKVLLRRFGLKCTSVEEMTT
jgi:hypothetical protein